MITHCPPLPHSIKCQHGQPRLHAHNNSARQLATSYSCNSTTTSSINWYRLRLGVKCTTGAVLGMLAAIRRILRVAAYRRHSSIVLTCGCHCTVALSGFCHLRRYINCRCFTFCLHGLEVKISTQTASLTA